MLLYNMNSCSLSKSVKNILLFKFMLLKEENCEGIINNVEAIPKKKKSKKLKVTRLSDQTETINDVISKSEKSFKQEFLCEKKAKKRKHKVNYLCICQRGGGGPGCLFFLSF